MHWSLDAPAALNRRAELRESVALGGLAAVLVADGQVAMAGGRVVVVPPERRPAAALEIYLGEANGQGLVAVVPVDGVAGFGADATPTGLREALATAATPLDTELAATAVALATWHANHPRCSVCGEPTQPTNGGWVRRCERDGRDHYPRSDPAVIVAITDADDRILLAHTATFSPHRYSHLAGYVEPGETFEQAVHREVFEESGLLLGFVTYAGSQPWPFPASIMVAFRARAIDPALTIDGVEITDAMWMSRAQLAVAVTKGDVVLAPHGSIARRLIHEWWGDDAPLPSVGESWQNPGHVR